jgi:DNA-binding response OmpR family regulator
MENKISHFSGKQPAHRILVVDDEPLIRRVNTEVLINSGYRVDAAEDGAVAWQALNTYSYDLLIADNDMPKVSGVGLLKKIHAARMALPVIMATGTFPKEEFIQYPWLQPAATLLKPYTMSELMETAEKVLHKLSPTPFADFMFYPEKLEAALKITDISQTRKPTSALPQYPPNSPQRILVVDDNNAVRKSHVDMLVDSGYDVEAAKDGADGWEALQAKNYDLVITDNKMPRMTGIEMIEKLRYARMTVPLIMATGILPTDEFARKPWLKPEAMLEKPFSNDDLLETVKKILHTDDGNDNRKEPLSSMHL